MDGDWTGKVFGGSLGGMIGGNEMAALGRFTRKLRGGRSGSVVTGKEDGGVVNGKDGANVFSCTGTCVLTLTGSMVNKFRCTGSSIGNAETGEGVRMDSVGTGN